MKTKAKRDLAAVETLLADKGEELLTFASKLEEDELTDDERNEVDRIRGEVADLQEQKGKIEGTIALENDISKLGRDLKGHVETVEEQRKIKSLGEQFVESDEYQALLERGLSNKFSTGAIELRSATLLEGTPDSPGAGGAFIQPQRQAGVVPILFERLTIADLIASGQTTTTSIEYVRETVADAGSAATVAETGQKPETRLEFDLDDSPVRKIAVFLPVSDEMLEDVAQIRSYINARLTLFVKIEEENQILNKTGSGTDLNGLLNQVPAENEDATVATEGLDTTDPNGADHIFAALTVARRSFLEPDGIVVNTDDWARLRLLKDGNGNYIAGSPFSTGAGEPEERLWNKRVVVTSAIDEGTALVGAFGLGAQIFRRGGLTVEASNSHADYFRHNMTAIRSEERLALVVYRPQAFATADVTGANS
jgi:HK97 family phage major capsid protein